MSKKHFGRLVMVLFLLAALPGMTAVVAQGQEPPGKMAAQVPNVVVSESPVEPNAVEGSGNDIMDWANEIDFDDVVFGWLESYGTDVDFFKFYVPTNGTAIIVNTDARLDGNLTDTNITVYDEAGTVIGYNDDVGPTPEEYDSLLYLVLPAGWYYVKLTNDMYNDCGDWCYYELMVHNPLLISAAAAKLGTGYVASIPFRSEDILAFAKLADGWSGYPQHKWLMFLDGSDVGFTKPLVNLSTGWTCFNLDCPSLAVSFSANLSLTDYQGVVRTVKPWDWVEFQVERIGPNSAIRYANGNPLIEVHTGVQHSLTTTSEKLDALDVWNHDYAPGDYEAYVYLSTTGAASVPKYGGGTLKLADEDLLWSETYDGLGTWNNRMEFDGSQVAGMGVEDIFAADYVISADRLYLTILGNGKIMNHPVTQQDIFVIYWNNTWNTWDGIAWHGPDYGWNYNIDAFDWPGN